MPEHRRSLDAADRSYVWPSVSACVVGGLGVSGFAAADALVTLGAQVTILDDADTDAGRDRATLLEILGATIRMGAGSTDRLPADIDLVVVAPGISPGSSAFEEAAARDLPLWGEVELGWRLRDPEALTPWLCVTGTNGKTTTVQMLAAMLRADGLRAEAVGNVGLPVCEAVMNPEPYDVLAVELSSQQLHSTTSLSAEAAVVLNLAPDHLSWHGGFADYAADKARIYHDCRLACVYNVEDEATRRMVAEADVVEGCRAIGFTLGVPAVGMLGVVDGVLADRAFVTARAHSAAELAQVSDVPTQSPHNVANALAAAALARAHGVAPASVRLGLDGFALDRHRLEQVTQVSGVSYIDDSKATNPHAAQAAISGLTGVVWIAGGLAKGATFDDLVQAVRPRLRAAVLIGADRAEIAAALARHAPEVPVIDVPGTDTGAMDRAVAAAAPLAQVGDTVLLAPACASQDMFASYADRGDAFVAAVRRLRGR